MISAIGVAIVVVGATIAHLAGRFPPYAEALEAGGGALLIGGLALLGAATPILL